MATTLVINNGSTSKKYALYEQRQAVLEFRYERTGTGYETCTKHPTTAMVCRSISATEYDTAFAHVATAVAEYLRAHATTLDAICVRVLAPGKEFNHHTRIDAPYLAALRQRELSSPLHTPTTLRDITEAQRRFPAAALVAASDTAFHSSLPEHARAYSISRADAAQYDIYRYGCHGLSVASVVRRIHPVTGQNPARTVVVHVGGGVSVTALKNNTSIDTTVGYAPASGLPMGSRAGDLDAVALLQLMRAKNLRPTEAEMYLYTNGGLHGLGNDSDVRRLLDRRAKGDQVARQALDLLAYHIKKAIAAMTVPLGGLDMVVLTGTACARSAELRTLLLSDLTHLGVVIDENRNESLVNTDGVCSAKDSAVKVAVIRTDEMGEMVYVAEQVKKR